MWFNFRTNLQSYVFPNEVYEMGIIFHQTFKEGVILKVSSICSLGSALTFIILCFA